MHLFNKKFIRAFELGKENEELSSRRFRDDLSFHQLSLSLSLFPSRFFLLAVGLLSLLRLLFV